MVWNPINIGGRFTLATFNEILAKASEVGVSDVRFISGVQAFGDLQGVLFPITDRAVSQEELLSVMKDQIVYGPQAEAELANKQPLDFPYQIRTVLDPMGDFTLNKTEARVRGKTLRFRCNVTAAAPAGEVRGVHITIRTIPEDIPLLADLGGNLPLELVDAMWPSQGMTLITGETGSGKTTLAASLIQDYGLKPHANRTLVALEAPIEFIHPVVGKGGSFLVIQHQVGRHIESFPQGVANAMRQKPNTIFLGEMRDPETIRAGVTASLTGHHLLSTAHTNSVGATVRRLIIVFPGEEQMMMQADIVASLQVIITQRLVKIVEGGRVPIREFLIFDEAMRTRLLASNPVDIGRVTAQLVMQYGRPMIEDIEQLRAEKRISDFTYKQLLLVYGSKAYSE